MRPIDADIAINILNESIAINRTDVAMGLRLAMYEIDMLPTIDAVSVVRCKDCKYYEETNSRIGTCLLTVSGAEIDGFCSWGERGRR